MESNRRIVVAGHLCLDIVPEIQGASDSTAVQMFRGGQLTQIGAATLQPGGAVANTGQALRILGADARLMGKVGDDRFGRIVGEMLESPREAHLPGAPAMIVDSRVSTSYTIVLTPPDIDRVYFHCPGANDKFTANDVDYDLVATSALFHFGYPPLMARMYEGRGEELARIFRLARERGVATSLDMAMPDPGAAAGRAEWREILLNTLPYVDLFLPSAEETVRMLHPEWEAAAAGESDANLDEPGRADGAPDHSFAGLSLNQLSALSSEVLEMGCAVVVLKLGADGIYLRTALGNESSSRELPPVLASVADEFDSRELVSSCYTADVVSAVGAGDATVAGFLAAVLRGLPLAQCANMALGVGAKSVEDLHSTGGISGWDPILSQIKSGWEKHPLTVQTQDWRYVDESDLWERFERG